MTKLAAFRETRDEIMTWLDDDKKPLLGKPACWQTGIRSVRVTHSEVGKVKLGPYIVERTTVTRKKVIHLP